MCMSDLKIVYAFSYRDANAVIVNFLKNKMVTELTAAGISVARIEMARTKLQVEDLLDTGEFHLLIVKEQLGEDKISSGSIKGWSQRYPDLQVILCVGNDKKGGEKLNRLLNAAPFYYDALYENDLTGDNVAKLLKSSRSKEDAICYYGLEQRVEEDVKMQSPLEDEMYTERSEEVTKQDDKIKDEVESSSASVNDKADVSAEELEAVISGFDTVDVEMFEENSADVESSTDDEVGVINKDQEVNFDYSDMFSGNDLFGDFYKEKEVSLEEEILSDGEDVVVVDVIKEDRNKQTTSEEEKMDREIGGAIKTEALDILPEYGKVLKVFDSNTMLVELSPIPSLFDRETLEDYKMFFIVKGTKGSFVNGKYKVGVKGFEGYAGSMLGKQTIIVETPEYNLLEHKLEGAECSIIWMEQ